MKLSELIASYGDDKVQFQNLDQCTESLKMNKGHSKITFGTEQPVNLDGTERMGLVVWLDRKRVAEIIAEAKTNPTPAASLRGDLYDAEEFMADGGDTPMTAAENVLAWLLVEKIGVPDDIGYSPNHAQDIIVAAIDDAGKQLVEGGELLLTAEAAISEMTELCRAAKDVISCASDTYKKRNGRRGSFEDEGGEKCWIVPFDAFEGLRSAVAALSATATEGE